MPDSRIKKKALLSSLPPEWPADLLPHIQQQVETSRRKVVVLDDDPTGTQTVHNIPVLTEWPVEALSAELANPLPAFYLLTNSRSLPLNDARALNTEIARNLLGAAQQTGREFVVVSRSDSTLRGHFPGEVEALANALAGSFDAWLIIPFFLEGNRYTANDIHYVQEDDWLTPAGQTEFARDSAFGYRASNLRQWVSEKTDGRVHAGEVISISLDDIRQGGPERVLERLLPLCDGAICAVNAVSYRDMEVFVQGLLTAEARGKRFLYRTAASFVRVRAGLEPRPLLTQADLGLPESGGGLIVVGSYVPKTTSQVNALLKQHTLASAEVNIAALLNEARRQSEIKRVAQLTDDALKRGENVVVYTDRKLVTADDAEASLSIGQRVSDGLISIVRAIATRPRYLIAKGGITSSDVATKGLGIKRAMVRGQIIPGVPVWQTGPESRHPGMPYVVFPGNVGGSDALAEVVTKLTTE